MLVLDLQILELRPVLVAERDLLLLRLLRLVLHLLLPHSRSLQNHCIFFRCRVSPVPRVDALILRDHLQVLELDVA